MTVSVPLITLMAVAVYLAYRYSGLRAWQAVACVIFGFLLAATSFAPQVSAVLSGIVHWAQAQLSGGKG